MSLSDAQIDAAILLYPALGSQAGTVAFITDALAELKRRRAIERMATDTEQVSRLMAVERFDATGPGHYMGSPAGSMVNYRDYAAALEQLLPYRTELLRIAEALGEPNDPFALWEKIGDLVP